jgi:hypothetical protein
MSPRELPRPLDVSLTAPDDAQPSSAGLKSAGPLPPPSGTGLRAGPVLSRGPGFRPGRSPAVGTRPRPYINPNALAM